MYLLTPNIMVKQRKTSWHIPHKHYLLFDYFWKLDTELEELFRLLQDNALLLLYIQYFKANLKGERLAHYVMI